MAVTKEEIARYLKRMSLQEASELVKELEEVYGVSSAVATLSRFDSSTAEVPVSENINSFDVILTNVGSNKIAVIKAIREIVTGLGLKEAKELVDNTPKLIKEVVSKDEAESIKSILSEVGARVEIKNLAYFTEPSSLQSEKLTDEEYERKLFENLDELKIINDRIQNNRIEINWLSRATNKTLNKINNLIEAM